MSTESITVSFQREFWRKDEFAMAKARVISSSNNRSKGLITIKGDFDETDLMNGAEYTLFGTYQFNEQYGPNFAFTSYSLSKPVTRDGVVRYLSILGKGNGIGEGKARRLFKEFKDDTLHKFKTDFLAVNRITGIDKDQWGLIIKKLEKFEHIEKAMTGLLELLAGYSIPRNAYAEMIEELGINVVEIVKASPWVMLNFSGIGFKTVDKFFLNNGGDPRSIERSAHYGYFTCFTSDRTGTVWVSRDTFDEAVCKEFDVDPQDSIDALNDFGAIELYTDGNGEEWVADATNARIEHELALRVAELVAMPTIITVDKDDEDFSELSGHQYTNLKKSVGRSRIGMLHGQAGSGKTFTVSRVIKWAVRNFGAHEIAVCAPTGKAAVRINEMLREMGFEGISATTIHSMLLPRKRGNKFTFGHNKLNPMNKKLVICDEDSMVSASLMNSMLQATGNAQVILVGDPENQLAPVGVGCPALDMTKVVPYGRLTEIRRNAGTIVTMCDRITKGLMIEGDERLEGLENLALIPASKGMAPKVLAKIVRRVIERHEESPETEPCPVNGSQVIVALNEKSAVSREKLNPMLQDILNPNGKKVEKTPFRASDKVYCTLNGIRGPVKKGEDSEYVANGEFGSILPASNNGRVCVDFLTVDGETGRMAAFPRSKKARPESTGCDLELGYAATCHKYQGSEVPISIVMIDESWGASGPEGIADRNWLYTAISRARKFCFVIGKMSTIQKIIDKKTINKRKTFLAEKIAGGELASV